jgi:isoaspartyl peptidase/L-asparaginase-like protein (Ntn-hydrolase superfamily)
VVDFRCEQAGALGRLAADRGRGQITRAVRARLRARKSRSRRQALERGAERRLNDYFITDRQRQRLREHTTAKDHGTVGAVCLDTHGVLAAATSTGGITAQPPGRVGDTPLIGAGTWADKRVAVSCTGTGEAFIRAGAAARLATLVECGASLVEAADRVLADVSALGGSGGLIAVDASGHTATPYTTETLLHAVWRSGSNPNVRIPRPAPH